MQGTTEFGAWLQRKREEKGRREQRRVPIAEVARRAGYSRQYLSFLEAGVNPSTGKPIRPDEKMARALARALDAPEDEALEAAGLAPGVTPRLRPLVRQMERLTERELDVVRHLLDHMTSDQHTFALP